MSPSSACFTLIAVLRARIAASTLGCCGVRWRRTTTAASRLDGSRSSTDALPIYPPADPTRTTTSRLLSRITAIAVEQLGADQLSLLEGLPRLTVARRDGDPTGLQRLIVIGMSSVERTGPAQDRQARDEAGQALDPARRRADDDQARSPRIHSFWSARSREAETGVSRAPRRARRCRVRKRSVRTTSPDRG